MMVGKKVVEYEAAINEIRGAGQEEETPEVQTRAIGFAVEPEYEEEEEYDDDN